MAAIERPRREPPAPGRPSSFTDELADEILERIACGETVRSICRDESMPDRSSVMRWAVRDDRFRERYARARELQADAWLDMIADHLRTPPARDAAGRVDPVAARRHRDQAGTMRWLADKLRSRRVRVGSENTFAP